MDYLNNLFTSLTSRIGQLLPGILGAILVLILGLFLASGVKRLVLYLFKKTQFDEKLSARFKSTFKFDHFVARLAYFLVVVYMLLLVLDMMGVKDVLAPLQNMMNEFLGVIPNVVAAILIGFAGYVIATLASEATGFLASTLQGISEKAGLKGALSLEAIVKKLVFIFVFIPILIAAIDALQLKVISDPATQMFAEFLAIVPQVLSAGVIIAVFYLGGRYVIALLTELLHSIGTDKLSDSLGLAKFVDKETSLSKIIGNIAFFFLMFGGIIAAVDKLLLPQFSEILNNTFEIAAKVFFGIVILFIGNYLANLAKKAVTQSENNEWLGTLAKFSILFIFLALGLSTMGIGQDIVNIIFGITAGAIGVAFALSFGLGGREAAGKYAAHFFEKLKKKDS
ncbi:MAG: mechanosensitive ion channel [Saprospiraceae bacterium]|nr:mechanosensitive ion channel [Saprospiraceae bacterium]MCF8249117.1 mechanosensitive ion channel [Saprospiraceae bacterium]MCF8281374.1 mechanosensitive ion channel [Bacteroidales bacterium]MCF8311139.1 mechanosensitive ion channel [Saprospiraceae bacterium]MCF8440229.1 mechanosensitive ion channel [Saprospiraceae bacterium]